MLIYKNTCGYLTCDLFDNENIKKINQWYQDVGIPVYYNFINGVVYEYFAPAVVTAIEHCGECYKSSNS